MTENTKPEFKDILNLIAELPEYPQFKTDATEPMAWLQAWLTQYSRTLDLSRGFQVNRCALYWTGYDAVDAFDGQSFVDACQDSQGSLRQLAQILDTDLQIFELNPTNTTQPVLEEITMAASYGMMGVEENTQLFCACSFGQGVETASQKALNALSNFDDLESFMITYCGLDHAAMVGAAVACIMKGVPMILDGTSGKLVKALLKKTAAKQFDNLILSSELNLPTTNPVPGQNMILTAVMLKSLYAASIKTDCGKVKDAA